MRIDEYGVFSVLTGHLLKAGEFQYIKNIKSVEIKYNTIS
jgi:hypothetical protein